MKDTIHSSPVLLKIYPSGSQYMAASPLFNNYSLTKGLAS